MPPTDALLIDAKTISGITGSISVACWIVVFSPQIVENYRRTSAEGLSLAFLIIWLAGDVFNVLGSMFQQVLPTKLILAVYYTVADIILIGQVFYYKRCAITITDPIDENSIDDLAALHRASI